MTQAFITRQIDALGMKRHYVGDKLTSLVELGFNRVGIDAGFIESQFISLFAIIRKTIRNLKLYESPYIGWNLCTGPHGSWHDETGHFIIDKTRFPDMKAMTDHAHSLGIKMDFYLNQVFFYLSFYFIK